MAVVRGAATKRQRGALDEAGIRALLTACARRDRALFEMVIVMIALGLRRGELLGLRASRIDIASRTVRIDGQIVYQPGGAAYVERTKTKTVRTIVAPVVISTLLAERLEITRQQRTEHPEWPVNDFVWLTNRGEFVHPLALGVMVRDAAKEAGVTVMLHELRHTAASLYVMLGVPDTQVRDILGHTSTAMTARYSHAMAETAVKSADAMGGLLERFTQ
jgi:integrase